MRIAEIVSYSVLIVIPALVSPVRAGSTSDFIYEKRLSDSIARSMPEGRVVWLKSEQRLFLALYLETEARSPSGAVIILPGISDHVDSAGLVHELRTSFATKGWNTLSLQMPVKNPGRDLQHYFPLVDGSGARIESAMDYLANEKIKQVVLIGHDFGAWMALDYLKNNSKSKVIAVVLVGIPVVNDGLAFRPQIDALKKTKTPVLDIFGSRDLDSVLNSAGLRRQWMKNNESFRQTEIAGASHEFHNETRQLFKRIYGWLSRNFPETMNP